MYVFNRSLVINSQCSVNKEKGKKEKGERKHIWNERRTKLCAPSAKTGFEKLIRQKTRRLILLGKYLLYIAVVGILHRVAVKSM